MDFRRLLLVIGFLGLLLSAAHRADAGTGEVEVDGYGGTGSGGWACGPRATVKYGGAGGEARVRPFARSDAPASAAPTGPAGAAEAEASDAAESSHDGFIVSAAGAVEHRAYRLLECNAPCEGDDLVIPPTGLVGAGDLKAGYDWRYFGFRAGGMVWQQFSDNTNRSPSTFVLPELALRVGPTDSIRGELGFGSYAIPTLLRPGAYAGIAYSPARRWDIALHGGVHQTFDTSAHGRFDLAVKAPLGEYVQVGAGAGLSGGANDRVEPEGRLGLTASF